MKKGKFFALGLVVLLLAGSLILMACGNSNCPGDGKCKMNLTGALSALEDGFCPNAQEDGLAGCFGTEEPSYGAKCGC